MAAPAEGLIAPSLVLAPSLASIPPNVPFLDALAAWWLRKAGDDPLRVADGLFVVPTRRAVRGLTEAFLAQGGGRPLLLPRIVPLGGLGEDPLALAGALTVKQAVAPAVRLAVLTRFVLALNGHGGAPRTADRAWLLAAELANLLDEAARAEIDLAAKLPDAAGGDFAEHWNVTLAFLSIVTREWPGWLEAQGLVDVAARQIALLDAQAASWSSARPDLPVVVAGTTGAIPAVARLLKVVAHMPGGLVVLPGLEPDAARGGLDDDAWDALGDTHPQSSLRNLLAALGATRGDVEQWSGETSAAPEGRVAALRTALLPAASLSAWRSPVAFDLGKLQRLAAADEQEEATSIALALRAALDAPGTRAALVTPDRVLAQRVAAELLRFGVVADDSAGEKLAETPPAVFLRLLAEAVAEGLRPVPLLALLKHPFTAAGLSQPVCRAEVRRLERQCLRGARPGPGIEGLRHRKGDAAFLDRLASCLRPLLDLAAEKIAEPVRAMQALLESAEALAATDEMPGAARLWAAEDGDALATHLAALNDALPLLPPQDPKRLPALLDAILEGAVVRSRRALRGRDGTEHPRVLIWGLLEARLQAVDFLVLGGLAETVWPPATDPGPWMNRSMRSKIGLPSPEERVGLAAHDFVITCCAAPKVVLSTPARRERAPAIPSRWMVRLDALLAASGLSLPTHPAASWAGALDRPAGAPKPVSPPAPSPPVALRPRKLSVTEVETWLRDPYAIYAKHVLGLRKLEPLEESADAADYGTIVHRGLSRFFERHGISWPADAARQLKGDMDWSLDEADMRPALAVWWRPRLHRIAEWVAVAERDRRLSGRLAGISSEIKGTWSFPAPAGEFTLRAQADRIERNTDGTIGILDYKTGSAPLPKDVESGRSPQLPLEAAMAVAGAFGAELRGQVVELTYWQISGGNTPGKVATPLKDADKLADTVAQAGERFRELVAAFDVEGRRYLCRPSPGAAPRFSDYVKLARVAEWQEAEGE